MPAIRGITISSGYGPLLEITLVRNMRHLAECWVVTSPEDKKTQAVVESVPGAQLFVTDAMTRHGARMNKGLCFEECWDAIGRHGWILIWDSDILFPDELPLDQLQPDRLHGCRRRILEDPTRWHPDLEWRHCIVSRDGGPVGYWQVFHADDPAIRDKRPWYDVSFTHAGGGDAFFLTHWPASHRVVLPFDVLHLGKTDMNWFGIDQSGQDMMARFVHENGWRGAQRKHTPEAARRAPDIVERVQVPGYPPSNFELPFVRRAKQLRGHSSGGAKT